MANEQQMQPPSQAPPQGAFSKFDEEQMNVKQQERLEDYVLRGYNIIYHKGQTIAKMVARNPLNKVTDVAEAGNMVAQRLDSDARVKKEEPFPDEIKAVGGYHIIEKIIQLAEHGGAGAFEPAEKKMALQGAYQKYIEQGIKNKTIDPVELARATEEVQPGAISEPLAAMGNAPAPGGQEAQAAMPPGAEAPMQEPQQGAAPQGQPQAPQPQQPQGLLTQPTALQQLQQGGQ